MTKIFKAIYKYWMKFANFIGEINFQIIFTIFFFFLIGAYSIIKKLFSKKELARQTNWIEKKYNEPSIDILKRQF